MEEILNKNIIDYKFSTTEYQRLLEKIVDAIKENKNIIEEANKIDLKYYNRKVELSKIEEIIEKYRNDEIRNNQNMKKCLIEFNGDIYITIQLCIWAILNKKKIILDINNYLFALNTVIVKIVNIELKKYGIENMISIYELEGIEEIEKNAKNLDQIICIDDSDIYNEIGEIEPEKTRLIKFNSIDLYCDDDDLVELRDMVCDYARNNHWQLELFDDEEKNKVADIIKKHGEGAIVILLSQDKELQDNFKNKLLDRELYINKFPFDETKKIKI